ncbi:SIMPL domain-containing protein [Microbacterium sp. M28]|uniref:SIMPL domain-containing protein n=1 Tax=Microbacterium sp. M28 TaxID=2962064 RepID=UPI0021F4BF7A|nr:SIMPL domain-containing protein [Microbacterium sp. M28]UYO98307.1 SIMPL domain-containing protein [Microbacterium sp. M28]
MAVITAAGLGEQHVVAERATLSAEVAIAHVDRDMSIRQGARVHAQLAEEAVRLRASGAATWHSVDVLSTSARVWTDKNGAKHRDHLTRGTVRIKMSRLAEVADVVAALSALGATVSTSWALTEVTRDAVTRHLRSVAVKDASAKAADFAAALGQTVQRVVAIREDQGYAPQGGRGSGGGPELTIPEITVRVAVTGDFETE